MAPAQAVDESLENLLKSTVGVNAIPLSPIPKIPIARPLHSLPDHPGKPLRRFYLRGLVSLLVPPVVTAYYFAIWYGYLNGTPTSSPISFGPQGGLWMYYSWFLIGVIGLGLSQYGLEAIEAQMLTEPTWAVDNAMLVMMHGDHSWSGPGGWLKVVSHLLRFRSKRLKGVHLLPSKLWWLLTFLTLPVFIALPLSGLVMNFGDGFVRTGTRPEVIGFGWNTFNDRFVSDVLNGAGVIWQYNFGAKIPGLGVIYTPENVDRTNTSVKFLTDIPSSLPAEEGIDRVFLIPQADAPVEGYSFGLALEYSCSIVDDVNDFSILRYHDGSKAISSGSFGFSYFNANNDSINIYNQTHDLFDGNWAENLASVIEFGYSPWPKNITSTSATSFLTSNECYFSADPINTGHYPGLETSQVLEILLWQSLFTNTGLFDPTPTYNTTLNHNITSLYGAYKTESNASMSAIGLRCFSSSAVGSASISPKEATFSHFIASDTPIKKQYAACPDRLGPLALISMFGKLFQTEWRSALFTSVSAQPPFYAPFSDDISGGGQLVQLSLFQPEQLRKSILRAYAAYAVQLMYNGGQGFSSIDGIHNSTFTHPNLTAYEATTVLQGGVVPPIIPAVLLVIWALSSFVLTCIYGFRFRWAATLDGYSLFVFGADLAGEVKRKGGLGAMLDAEHSEVLRALPGMVGDGEPDAMRGKIGLVNKREGGFVRKGLSKTRRYI